MSLRMIRSGFESLREYKTIFKDIHYKNLTVIVGYRILIAQDDEYLRCNIIIGWKWVWVLMNQIIILSNLQYGWNCFVCFSSFLT